MPAIALVRGGEFSTGDMGIIAPAVTIFHVGCAVMMALNAREKPSILLGGCCAWCNSGRAV
jgi:Tfp pilus assembly protein PilZ